MMKPALAPLFLTLALCLPWLSEAAPTTYKATTTTGMITDLVRTVAGDHFVVTGLMGPGVDPHLYKASERDIRALAGANVIFYNGLNLEGKLGDLLLRMTHKKPTFAISDNIPGSLLREPPEFQGHYDPHIWFDVSLWITGVDRVQAALEEAVPDFKADYAKNAAAYKEQLTSLHQWCKEQIATIPKAQRVLVTAHDAFGYFGRAYDIEVKGIQGISTESEASVRQLNELVAFLAGRKVKAVFVESSVPRKNIEALVEGCKAQGHPIAIGGELYSDALGADGTPEGTYTGMVRHNVATIVKALR